MQETAMERHLLWLRLRRAALRRCACQPPYYSDALLV